MNTWSDSDIILSMR